MEHLLLTFLYTLGNEAELDLLKQKNKMLEIFRFHLTHLSVSLNFLLGETKFLTLSFLLSKNSGLTFQINIDRPKKMFPSSQVILAF